MTKIETVRMLTGNTEISDDFISFYLDSTEKFIKGYCNIDTIPEDLEPTFLEITSMRVKANSSGSKAALGEGLKTVGSISDGNQSIGYQLGGGGTKTFISEEDFVAAYGYMLDRWRRMVVPKSTPKRTCGSRCLHDTHPHPNRARW